jgi:hypothetical protein
MLIPPPALMQVKIDFFRVITASTYLQFHSCLVRNFISSYSSIRGHCLNFNLFARNQKEMSYNLQWWRVLNGFERIKQQMVFTF